MICVLALSNDCVGLDDPGRREAGIQSRESLPTVRTLDYDFQQVSIDAVETWLKWIGIQSPIPVSGNVSGWLWTQRSDQGWFDFKNYWLEGQMTASELVVDTWQIDAAELRFGYRDGVWHVGKLSGYVTPPNQTSVAARVDLAGTLPAAEDPLLSLSGAIDEVKSPRPFQVLRHRFSDGQR